MVKVKPILLWESTQTHVSYVYMDALVIKLAKVSYFLRFQESRPGTSSGILQTDEDADIQEALRLSLSVSGFIAIPDIQDKQISAESHTLISLQKNA